MPHQIVMVTRRESTSLKESVEDILSRIIDEWYERVSGYYVTQADVASSVDEVAAETVQLKRFHDSRGHRIKFNKDDLDFTYGLKSKWHADEVIIEISVNNKVENFDYDAFRARLISHYAKAGVKPIGTPVGMGELSFDEVFQLESEISKVFAVEKRKDKADIMRLSFRIKSALVKDLVTDQEAIKSLIESYCVSPFRSIYAKVYRGNP